MNILVTYESRKGTTRRAAEAIAAAARGEGHHVVVVPTAEATPQGVKDADVVFVGSWVEGFVVAGVKPAKPVRRFLAGLSALGGKPAAVFLHVRVQPPRDAGNDGTGPGRSRLEGGRKARVQPSSPGAGRRRVRALGPRRRGRPSGGGLAAWRMLTRPMVPFPRGRPTRCGASAGRQPVGVSARPEPGPFLNVYFLTERRVI